jgi:BAAT / Acyl-CoA thioester hydrolase C terminal
MRVHVLRDTLLIDEPLQLAASGCEPGKTVWVAATIRTPEAVGRSSATMAELAVRRAAGHGFAHKLTHLRYPAAGHNCAGVSGIPLASWIDHPLTGGRYSFGGTPAINARARIDSWPRVIAFLRETLPPIISGSVARRHPDAGLT